MKTYVVFVRNWWRYATEHDAPWMPGELMPHGGARRTVLRRHVRDEQEAIDLCRAYNERHDPGPLSRKAEYESEGD